jgi:glycine/D-amino acid oxidase-like deaminating enzyme
MDYPGFVWEPDLAGVALVAESLPTIMPALRSAGFAKAWAGILPFTTDNLPIIDAVPDLDDAVVAAGHVFGNAAGPTTGRIVADLVCGGEPFMDISPFRADRPGLHDPVDTSVW